MKHIRIPITDRHHTCPSYEGAWFGYIYAWQAQPKGMVNTRIQWFDPRTWPNTPLWEDTTPWDRLPEDSIVSFEEDLRDIIEEHSPLIYQAGTVQMKVGRQWVTAGGLGL